MNDINLNSIRALSVKEAISALGYLLPEAEESVIALLQDSLFNHPRKVCTNYRMTGEQLSKEEKKSLGLRANAFMSRKAFSELTDKGRKNPLEAHMITLLRAEFTRNRYKTVHSARMHGYDDFVHDPSNSKCPACMHLKEMGMIKGYQAQIFPPTDCTLEACSLCLRLHIDFIGYCIEEERAERNNDSPTIEFLRRSEEMASLCITTKSATKQDGDSFYIDFDFTCRLCGSEKVLVSTSKDGVKICVCAECEKKLSNWSEVELLAKLIADREARRLSFKQ